MLQSNLRKPSFKVNNQKYKKKKKKKKKETDKTRRVILIIKNAKETGINEQTNTYILGPYNLF